MAIIKTGSQTRWRDCFAPSEKVRLTLMTNGEEEVQVITPEGSVVRAGFDAPTVAPSLLVSAGGTLAQNTYYSYRYVYASTQYPFTQNAQPIGGELWPRSNPSPATQATTTSPNRTITVTVTKSTRSDIDRIAVYRTIGYATAAEDAANAEAGNMFYVGTLVNNGTPGTLQLVDNGIVTTAEKLETDNFTVPAAWFCVFDGIYWWAAGSPEFVSTVTLNGTGTVTLTGNLPIFSGRNSQVARFLDILSGGFDGRGGYYIRVDSPTTFSVYNDPDLLVATTVPFSGTTTVTIQGFASTLYRSKPYNPFSWGITEQQIVQSGSTEATISVPQQFALEMGGGSVTAMAVINNGKLLKVDFENPQRTLSYNLSFAESESFGTTETVIDNTGSVTCHFSQFNGIVNEQPVLMGLDTYNGNVLACDGNRQYVLSDVLGDFLPSLDRTDSNHRWFHGGYDVETEMNCWWVRFYDTTERLNMLVWNHSPTNQWGVSPDHVTSMSFICLDSDTNTRFLIGGSEDGHIGRLFDPTWYDNWINGLDWRETNILSYGYSAPYYTITTRGLDAASGQTILGTLPASAQFAINAPADFVVGDYVYLRDTAMLSTVAEGTVVDIFTIGDITTGVLNAPWTEPSGPPDLVVVSSRRMHGQWATICNRSNTQQWFAKMEFFYETPTETAWNITEYIQRGSNTVLVNQESDAQPIVSGIVYTDDGPGLANLRHFKGTPPLFNGVIFTINGVPRAVLSVSFLPPVDPVTDDYLALVLFGGGDNLTPGDQYTLTPELFTTAPWFPGYPGDGDPPIQIPMQFANIPAYLRMYFDLDDAVANKLATAFWITAENASFNPGWDDPFLSVRQYLDFDENSTVDRTFILRRDLHTDGTVSNVYFSHNEVPSNELKQMGFEIAEVGFENFTLYNFTIKTDKT